MTDYGHELLFGSFTGREPGSHERRDESARPVAPAAPDGYLYTDRPNAVGRHLAEVHDHLRQELSQVRDLLRQVKPRMRAGRARAVLNEMTMRQNNWTLGAYCAAYCSMITQHHGLEDQAIFPHLRRAVNPGGAVNTTRVHRVGTRCRMRGQAAKP